MNFENSTTHIDIARNQVYLAFMPPIEMFELFWGPGQSGVTCYTTSTYFDQNLKTCKTIKTLCIWYIYIYNLCNRYFFLYWLLQLYFIFHLIIPLAYLETEWLFAKKGELIICDKGRSNEFEVFTEKWNVLGINV